MFFRPAQITSAIDNEGDEWIVCTLRLGQIGHLIDATKEYVRILIYDEILSLPIECVEIL